MIKAIRKVYYNHKRLFHFTFNKYKIYQKGIEKRKIIPIGFEMQ